MSKSFDPFGHYEMLITVDGDDSILIHPCTISVCDKMDYDGTVFFSAIGDTADDVLDKAYRFLAKERLKKTQENKEEYLKRFKEEN